LILILWIGVAVAFPDAAVFDPGIKPAQIISN